MRILCIHSDFLEVEPKSKAIKKAEEVEKVKKRIEECLVVFSSVEKPDEGNEKEVAEKTVKEIENVCSQIKCNSVVVYPFVHLSSQPSSPDAALETLKLVEKILKEKKYEVYRAPFGWYKTFEIKNKGHPLAELSREIRVVSKEKENAKEETYDPEKLLRDISKATLSKEKLKENDHRIIGQNLDLYSFYNVAPGMPFWHPKGLIIRNELIAYWREEHRKAGYQEIMTPQIMSDVLWKVSGHWEHYKENNFSTKYEDRGFMVKPMNCPGGILIFTGKTRSYKELPMRVAELGLVHRVELSGVLSGLFRVVQITQDDAHIYCTEEQMEKEIMAVIDLIGRMYKTFGFEYSMELSTRPEKFMGELKQWDLAESILKQVLEKTGREYKVSEGEGCFYGPKIDFHIKDSLGRKWQTATIQLDFQMPQRFKIAYIGEDGKEHPPVMLHRTVYGSLERFVGILVEHYSGNFPLWLAPVQVKVVAFKENNGKKSEEITKQLFDLGYRAESDTTSGTVESKVRDAEMQKIPYIIVIGDKEEAANTLAVRQHGVKQVRFGVTFDQLKQELEQRIKDKN